MFFTSEAPSKKGGRNMSTAWVVFDCAIVLAFMVEGYWLESIGAKRDLFDRLLTPMPLGLVGIGFLLLGRPT